MSLNFILPCFSLYCLVVSLDVRSLTLRNSDRIHYFLQDQETANGSGSVILAESPLSMPESSLSLEEPAASVRNLPKDCNQPRTAKSFVLTAVQTEVKTKSPKSMPRAAPSPLRTFLPHKGGERSDLNEDISMPEIKHVSSEEQNEIVLEINEGSVRQRQERTRELRLHDALRQDRVVTDKIQRSAYSEDYLQPVDNSKLEVAIKSTDNSRLYPEKAQTLNWRPQPKPRMRRTDKSIPFKHPTFGGTLSNLQFTEMLKSNPLHSREALQQSTRLNPPNQTNHLVPGARTRHANRFDNGYQNEKSTATPQQNSLLPANNVEAPYACVLSNTNWEVPSDHLSLFEKIGGGSFGQVWKGAVLDIAGVQGWSIVAVKMLKGKQEHLIYRIIATVKMIVYIMFNIKLVFLILLFQKIRHIQISGISCLSWTC